MKRDPKRISPTLDRLKRVWQRHPELRLGQLISNTMNGKDIYYIEDELLVKEIELYGAGYYFNTRDFMDSKNKMP